MTDKMDKATKIGLSIVIFGMLLVGYSAIQINEGWNSEPDDERTVMDVQDHDGNETLIHSDTSLKAKDHHNVWSRPLMGVYSWVMVLGIILIFFFGLFAMISEGM